MQVSAEIRWFWQQEPTDLKEWFLKDSRHNYRIETDAEAEARRDIYLFDPEQTELGIKKRGGTELEIKGLVAAHWGELSVEPLIGSIELWSKWKSNSLQLEADLHNLITLNKIRWSRRFYSDANSVVEIGTTITKLPHVGGFSDTDFAGCNVEFAQVSLENSGQQKGVVWTFGLEAFGSLASLKNCLITVATEMRDRNIPMQTSYSICCSYPRFLSHLT